MRQHADIIRSQPEPAGLPLVLLRMTYYLIPTIIIAMLGYMFWSTIFRLRHDRVRTQRDLTRGKFAFRPRERMRFLLNRAFHVREEKSEWEQALVTSLAKAPASTRDMGARELQR